MKANSVAAIVFSTLLLPACGVTLEAKRVNTADKDQPVPSFIPGGGVVYALPKTDFEIVQPVKVKVPTAGPLQDIYENCQRACQATGDNVTDGACDFSNEPKVTYLPPELRTVSAPDYSRLYQVSPSADLFQTLDFKFSILANGVLESADTSATNMAYEVVSSLVGTAIKVVGAAGRSARMDLQSRNTKIAKVKPRSCYAVSTDVDTLTKSKTGTLQCPLVHEIESCLAPLNKVVEAERSAVNKLFDAAAKSKFDAELLAALAANRRERVNAAIAKRDEAASLYGLGEGKPKEASYQVVLPLPGPLEFTSDQKDVNLGAAVTAGSARISSSAENAVELLPILTGNLKAATRTYRVVTTMPANMKAGVEGPAMGNGYRYRVPTAAATTLTAYTDSLAKTPIFGPFMDRKVIAQYGPVAALPSGFKGKSGRVMVKLWPDSGGLQTVEIGAEAIPTSAVTGVIDESFKQYKDRKDKKDAAAAAAASADPELDSLSRQQKILDLKKQIKDLESTLKN
jgi:hypothetical protein